MHIIVVICENGARHCWVITALSGKGEVFIRLSRSYRKVVVKVEVCFQRCNATDETE